MRQLVAFALAIAALLALAAAASAGVEPRTLVLHPGDVPSGFRLDGAESGVRSNAREAKGGVEAARIIARSGRVSGYRNVFARRSRSIESRADLCRTPVGAAALLDWFDLEMRKSGIRGLKRSRVSMGDEGYIYWGGKPTALALVTWRHGRVWAGVLVHGLTKERAVALARVQQRRIDAVTG